MNDHGYQIYATRFNKMDYLNKLKNMAYGKFCFGDIFVTNQLRMLATWVEAFAFTFESP